VLCHIETFVLFFFADSNAHDELDHIEYREREDESESVNSDYTDQLGYKASPTEESNGKRSPDTAHAVDRYRTNRIIDLDLIEE
jgi:hypothetical protein